MGLARNLHGRMTTQRLSSKHTAEKKAVLYLPQGSDGTVSPEETSRERIKSKEQPHPMPLGQLSCNAPCAVGNCRDTLVLAVLNSQTEVGQGGVV